MKVKNWKQIVRRGQDPQCYRTNCDDDDDDDDDDYDDKSQLDLVVRTL